MTRKQQTSLLRSRGRLVVHRRSCQRSSTHMAICLSRTPCCTDARRMTRNPFPLPRELGAQFTTKAAAHLGVSGSRLRQADLEHPFYGTYRRLRYDGGSTSASLQSRHELWKQRQLELAATLMQRLPPDTFFGGRTAAAIWDLPMPHVPDDTLELVRLSPGRSLRLDRVRCTRIEAKYVRTTQHRGFPVTDAASTWCMPHDCHGRTVLLSVME